MGAALRRLGYRGGSHRLIPIRAGPGGTPDAYGSLNRNFSHHSRRAQAKSGRTEPTRSRRVCLQTCQRTSESGETGRSREFARLRRIRRAGRGRRLRRAQLLVQCSPQTRKSRSRGWSRSDRPGHPARALDRDPLRPLSDPRRCSACTSCVSLPGCLPPRP